MPIRAPQPRDGPRMRLWVVASLLSVAHAGSPSPRFGLRIRHSDVLRAVHSFKKCDTDDNGWISKDEFAACPGFQDLDFATCDRNKDSKITKTELEKCAAQHALDDCDKDKDGKLDWKEFAQCKELRGLSFLACDKDKDGKVVEAELEKCADRNAPARPGALGLNHPDVMRAVDSFKKCDTDGNGWISQDEFKACAEMKHLNFGTCDKHSEFRITKTELEKCSAQYVLDMCDKNKDHKLSKEEFGHCKELRTLNFLECDKNSDGDVVKAELEKCIDRKSANSFLSPVFTSRLKKARLRLNEAELVTIDRDLSVEFPESPEECFSAKEWKTSALASCGKSWHCPATKANAIYPNKNQVSTFLVRTLPMLAMRADKRKKYAAAFIDNGYSEIRQQLFKGGPIVDFGQLLYPLLHTLCVNIPEKGGAVDFENGECYGALTTFFKGSELKMETVDKAFFPPMTPTKTASTYAFLVWEQGKHFPSVSGKGNAVYEHGSPGALEGKRQHAGRSGGPHAWNVSAFSAKHHMKLRAVNWFSARGNAWSSHQVSKVAPPFAVKCKDQHDHHCRQVASCGDADQPQVLTS